MELVYLWVENYKNIKNQGFNFSPRFECKYKNNELIICDKKGKLAPKCENNNYIENFFSKNINITAIVGENGSGKSSIFEILVLFYMNSWQFMKKIEDNSFLLFKDKDDFYYMDKNTKGFGNKLSYKRENNLSIPPELISSVKKFDISYFCNAITDMTNNTTFEGLKTNKDTVSRGHFYNGKLADINDLRTLGKNSQFNLKFASLLQKKADFFNFIDEKFIFDSYNFTININEIGKYFHYKEDDEHIEDYKRIIELPTDTNKLFSENTTISNYKEHFYKAISLYIIFITFRNNNDSKKLLDELKVIIDNFSIEKYEEVYNLCLKNIEMDKTIIKVFNTDKLTEICNLLVFENHTYTSKPFDIKTRSSYIKNLLLNELLSIGALDFDFFHKDNKEYTFLDLSSGEREYLNFFTNFSYTLFHSNFNWMLMLLDEVELSFHPHWQKKIVKNIDDIIKRIKPCPKIDIIITSHSPFILSDLPKQNILFLKDGKQVKGIEKKQTFGANIHTLLSDSCFFMEGGLMGEFAKDKIKKIKRFYRKVTKYKDNQKIKESYKIFYDEKKQKEFWDIKSIIGEPFLQTVIKNYLDEIEIILFENKAKKIAIERFIDEFGKETVSEVMNSAKN